ncbi:MAG: thioredoxin family protein [Syntrophorhabdaceae bacterium]|nr:thioredoxin family protein [Syntrophorhabdaceae bacterium]
MTLSIDCYLSLTCPSEEELKKNIEAALKEDNIDAKIAIFRIDEAEASRMGIKGSPSVYINGVELQPQEIKGFS